MRSRVKTELINFMHLGMQVAFVLLHLASAAAVIRIFAAMLRRLFG